MSLVLAASATLAHAGPQADPAGAGSAAAASDVELAAYREQVELGTTAFREGRFADARVAFERAFAIHPDPVLLFNIASTWRRAGDGPRALTAYRRFLDAAPADDPRRSLAEKTIATLEDEPAPPPPPPPSTPAVTAPLPPIAAPERDRGSVLRPTGATLAVAGTLGLVAGGIEAYRAHATETELEGLRGQRWDQREADLYRRGERAGRRALLLGVGGAALAVTGVTLYYIGKRRDERALRLTVDAGADGGGAVLSGRF